MRKKNKIIILLLILSCLSCLNKKKDNNNIGNSPDKDKIEKNTINNKNDKKPLENKEKQKVNKIGENNNQVKNSYPINRNIVSQAIQVKPVIFSKRSSTIVYNKYLIQIETWTDTLFHVFKLPHCKHIGGFGRKGRGPKEFSAHDAYSAETYKNGIIINDAQKGFVFIDLKNFESNKKMNIEKKIELPGELMLLNDSFFLNDSTIIGSQVSQGKERFKYKYVKYNIHSNKINYFGQYPEYYSFVRKKLFPFIYVSHSAVKPDEKKFASFCNQVKMFMIYNSNCTIEKKILLEKQKDFFDGKWITKNPIKYYTCVRATNEYLFVLCHNEHTQNLPNNKPTLEIWDWNGNPIAYLKLDQPICSFDVTDDNSKIYATSFNDMDKIFLYKIRKYIN